MAKNDEVMIEDADIMFRNFSGREQQFNTAGQRNFCVMLDKHPDQLKYMQDNGWNIKYLKAREDGDEPRPYIQVKVEYDKGRPPRCVLVSSRGRTDLGAAEVDLLDVADLKTVDLIVTGYHWNVNENSGVKAYLKSIFATLEEDELDLKYADILDAQRSEDAAREEARV